MTTSLPRAHWLWAGEVSRTGLAGQTQLKLPKPAFHQNVGSLELHPLAATMQL